MADFREALRPLADRFKTSVREHEILRIAGAIHSQTNINAVGNIILDWAEKRSGGSLPASARKFENFESLTAGRNVMAVRLSTDKHDLWSLRAEDPDKNVAGRVWTTEVGLGGEVGKPIRFSARLFASSPETELDIQPHSPGFALQIADQFGLYAGAAICETTPVYVENEDDLETLLEELVSPDRGLPIIVASRSESSDLPLIDPAVVARAVTGIAHVRVLSTEASWQLTKQLGKSRSVFGGAVRIYYPGFSEDDSPYRHRLVVGGNIFDVKSQDLAEGWFRKLAAEFSLNYRKVGEDVIGFRDVRTASVRKLRESQSLVSTSDSERLKSADELIKSLTEQIEQEKQWNTYLEDEHRKAEDRALDAEQRAKASAYQIQILRDQLASANALPNDEAQKPSEWADIGDWVDQNLAGRLVLTAKAKRSLKKPKFDDARVAIDCLLWLANDCRQRKIAGGDGSLREAEVMTGIRNAHCGSDCYDTRWNDRNFTVDWHIKNGGNTRDPTRCLRIYYFWDDETRQIVVDELPEHRKTDAS